ncbi:MAG: hypothetical protein J7501_01280 [Bdellovibrio sp.]|nr:hypothetical protein [Bdellovibrio sp.]
MRQLFTSLITVLAAFTTTASASSQQQQAPVPEPTELCDGNPCSEPMLNVIAGYKDGVGGFANDDLTGFSGKCFHLNPQYNPNFAHHGGFVFDKTAGELNVSGMFSFFYGEDPYAEMSAEEMKAAFAKAGSTGTPAKVTEDHVEVAHLYDTIDIRYWHRTDASHKNLFVIGRTADTTYGMSSAVFCKMIRH